MGTANLNNTPSASSAAPINNALPVAERAGAERDWRLSIGSELQKLAALPANWDGYGAAPIDPHIIAAARRVVGALGETIGQQPRVVPMSAGNLQLEWHRGAKVLEFEFENPQTIRYLQWDPSAAIEAEDSLSTSELDRLAGLIDWFTLGTEA